MPAKQAECGGMRRYTESERRQAVRDFERSGISAAEAARARADQRASGGSGCMGWILALVRPGLQMESRDFEGRGKGSGVVRCFLRALRR